MLAFGNCVVLVVTSYRWSFSSCSLRSSHWAYESACFVQRILCRLVDESDLPCVFDVRASLEVDVGSLIVPEVKIQALRDEFSCHLDDFEELAEFEEQLSMVKQFMFVVVEEVLSLNGMKEEVTYHLSVCCPSILLYGDPALLSNEIELFTGLLMDLNRIGLAEKRRLDRSFATFLTTFRRLAVDVSVESASSPVGIIRACDNVVSQRLMRFLMCLGESPLFPANVSCVGVGELSSDVTTSVCSSILSYLEARHVRHLDSVSGPLVEDVMDSTSRLTALSELTEDMLWDDVGVVADEEYRQSLYDLMGFTVGGERAPSPEV